MTKEVWKDIEGYEGKYQVSDSGRVKSLNYLHTKKEKILKIEELENNDPHKYGGEWDNNPYGVEPQLASGSGCWEFPDWGEDKAYEDAKEYVINGFFEGYYNLPEVIEEFLECYDNKDREWLEAILNNIL